MSLEGETEDSQRLARTLLQAAAHLWETTGWTRTLGTSSSKKVRSPIDAGKIQNAGTFLSDGQKQLTDPLKDEGTIRDQLLVAEANSSEGAQQSWRK